MTRTCIADVLARKTGTVYTIDRSVPATMAVREMVGWKVGSLIVTDRGQLCGIVTERDFMRHMAREDYVPGRTRVQEIMTANVVLVEPTTTVSECMAIMTRARCRHLPVVKDGDLVGLVSIGDLVKQVSHEQRTEIHFLTEYILGQYPGIETRGQQTSQAGQPPI
jgi:CBS domain-containing protein